MLILLTKQEVKDLRIDNNKRYKLFINKGDIRSRSYKFNVAFEGTKLFKNKKKYLFTFLDMPEISQTTRLDIHKYYELWSLYREVSNDVELRFIRIKDANNLNQAIPLTEIKKYFTDPNTNIRKIYRLVSGKTLTRIDGSYNEIRVKLFDEYVNRFTIGFIEYTSTFNVNQSSFIYEFKLSEYKKTWALFKR